jgi:2-amino-4-hydroxy-6-hydroxymethyldihydropteridine diphosphokinase
MRFETWEPTYIEILQDFGFSRERDEEAGRLLLALLGNRQKDCLAEASSEVCCRAVVVCGNAPNLASNLEGFLRSSRDYTFIAADGATSILLAGGILPKIVVTDLDGKMEDIIAANHMGSIVAIHAHGDNLDQLREYVPQLTNIIGTTQSRPPQGLHNFGGFTDGDRCVFLAKYLGASEIELIGFDFEDERVTPRKRKKLAWARRLVNMALALEKCP